MLLCVIIFLTKSFWKLELGLDKRIKYQMLKNAEVSHFFQFFLGFIKITLMFFIAHLPRSLETVCTGFSAWAWTIDKSKIGKVKLTSCGKGYNFRVSLEENNKIMKGKLIN